MSKECWLESGGFMTGSKNEKICRKIIVKVISIDTVFFDGDEGELIEFVD